MDIWEQMKKEEKLAELRLKWLQAKKDGDTDKMAIYERMAKVVKGH